MTKWDNKQAVCGDKSMHILLSSLSLMYSVFIFYVCANVYFILNKSIKISHHKISKSLDIINC